MRFEQFAELHGLMINSLVLDRWVRVPTTDHPKKRNGAYIFDGRAGAIINFAVHEKHILFKSDEPYRPDPQARAKREKADREKKERQHKAIQRAAHILDNSRHDYHPYLVKKGFPEVKGYVWLNSLVLPMRIDGRLVGVQLISPDGTKRFLAGQQTKGASLMLDNKGPDIVCEGFATALSVKRALKQLRERYRIHVCFSAGNMIEVGAMLREPLVIADNDPVGLSAAKKISSRIWIGQTGEDFNDVEVRLGTGPAGDQLRPFL